MRPPQVHGQLRKTCCSPDARGGGGGRRGGGGGGGGTGTPGEGRMIRDTSGRMSVLSTQISEAFSTGPGVDVGGGGGGCCGDVRGTIGGSVKSKAYIPMISMEERNCNDGVSAFC